MMRFSAFLVILWAGLLLGVSFVATPVKFMAKNLSMPVAIEVGMVTFHLFNKIEWVLCISILLLTFWTRVSWWPLVCVGIVFVLLSFETFYLIPALDVRARHIIAGGMAEPSVLHWFY
ncbi:MAG: DUF4149 domain-containing protein, partial [Candidatus Nucleicultricaceae bacterium]